MAVSFSKPKITKQAGGTASLLKHPTKQPGTHSINKAAAKKLAPSAKPPVDQGVNIHDMFLRAGITPRQPGYTEWGFPILPYGNSGNDGFFGHY